LWTLSGITVCKRCSDEDVQNKASDWCCIAIATTDRDVVFGIDGEDTETGQAISEMGL